jgi:hypothetical protein
MSKDSEWFFSNLLVDKAIMRLVHQTDGEKKQKKAGVKPGL